jgi:ABC-type nitrate/sulfonate/bicarbonate transport system substrate-binding protein
MRKIFSLVVAGAALLAAGTARAQSNKLIIAVGGKTIIANLPLPVAYYHGDFKSEGLDVDIQDVQNGAKGGRGAGRRQR